MQPPRTLRAAWVEIDLDALSRNADRLERIAGGRPLRAVVKADAYGHGAVHVARALEHRGVERFAVALVEEGVELRRAGIAGEILVFGMCRRGQCPQLVSCRLVPTISSLEQLDMWVAAVRDEAQALPVHLEVNTGMNRLGMSPEELATALATVRSHPRLELAGLMSHLADADLAESPRTAIQARELESALDLLTGAERETTEIHLANSAGILHHEIRVDTVVRPGLALFGYDPAGRNTDLEPVMSVRARIVQTLDLAPRERVGYGGRWMAQRQSRVGTVPVGYADGYLPALGGRAEALVAGRRVPVIGAVSMDMLALDLTDASAGQGDEAVLLGHSRSETITASELASCSGTLVYGVLCGFGMRLPKLAIAGGESVAVSSRFESVRAPAASR